MRDALRKNQVLRGFSWMSLFDPLLPVEPLHLRVESAEHNGHSFRRSESLSSLADRLQQLRARRTT